MRHHEIALWSGIVALFTNFILIGIFELFNPDREVRFLGALLSGLITAGSVYAKVRLDDAKEEKAKKEVK